MLGGGWTLGIAKDVVTPPAAHAVVAVTMSSLWVKPGSRWCEWTSMAPGRTCRPVASMTRAASSGVPGATMAAMRSPAMARSARCAGRAA